MDNPIMYYFCRNPGHPLFRCSSTPSLPKFNDGNGVGQREHFSKSRLQFIPDTLLLRRAIQLWRGVSPFRNN